MPARSPTTPAERANQGASVASVFAGGRRSARAAPALTRQAEAARTAACVLRDARSPPTTQKTTPAAAAAAERTDQRRGQLQAPNDHEPTPPNRVQGSSVESSAAASARTHAKTAGRRCRRSSGGGEIASGPIASTRQSGQRTWPRTGTAHVRQMPRPHASQLPTEARPGWSSQRSPDFVVRSGTAASLRPGPAHAVLPIWPARV